MKVFELIKQLEELNKPNAEITLLGNIGNPEDEETDMYFNVVEVWNDGEDTITLFVGLKDLFENPLDLPKEVQAIIDKYSEMDNTYETCGNLVSELEAVGYTCSFGLDATPYDLRKS